jgi:hypothetical protein
MAIALDSAKTLLPKCSRCGQAAKFLDPRSGKQVNIFRCQCAESERTLATPT